MSPARRTRQGPGPDRPPPGPDPEVVLGRFTAATRAWFGAAFAGPTPAQVGAWDAVTAGRPRARRRAHRVRARRSPPSSGRSTGWPRRLPRRSRSRRCRVLYVSPLKALAVDVERNLRAR